MKNFWMTISAILFAGIAQAQSMGSLQVNGEAGSQQLFQKVKAVRCAVGQRGSCDAPAYFALNTAQALPPGSYIVGFENSIYPDYVNIASGQNVVLNLEKLTVPSQVQGGRIRVYRDLSTLIEQKKFYLTMFAMNRHFFRLDKDNFGDLYLAGLWERDFVQRFTYEICPRIEAYGEVSAGAKTVCSAWNTAKDPMGLRELFNFSNDGTVTEMWTTVPGDVIPTKHPRYLVSAPMTVQDFVSVFPGVYKFQADGKNMPAVTVRVGNLSQFSSSSGFSLNTIKSFISLDAGDCSTARTWTTESRAYCSSDQQEGCDRARAQSCVPAG